MNKNMNLKVIKELKIVLNNIGLNKKCKIEKLTNEDWNEISKYEYLSEDFIREFKDYVNWKWICMFQKLSESFIEEFADYVDWKMISIYQDLSESFIKKFIKKFNPINLKYIYFYQKHNFSESFIKKLELNILKNSVHLCMKKFKNQIIG